MFTPRVLVILGFIFGCITFIAGHCIGYSTRCYEEGVEELER